MPGVNDMAARMIGDASSFVSATDQAGAGVSRLDSKVSQFNRNATTAGAGFGKGISTEKLGSGIRSIGGMAAGMAMLSGSSGKASSALTSTIDKAQQFLLVAGSVAGPKGAAVALGLVGIGEAVKWVGNQMGWGTDKAEEYAEKMAQIDKERAAARAPIEAMVESLQREVDLYGKSAEQIALYELRQKGGTKADWERVLSLRQTISALEAKTKADKAAADLREELRERESKAAEKRGEEFGRALQAQSDLFAKLAEQQQMDKPQLAGFGTAAAASARFDAMKPREQIKLSEDQLKTLREIDKGINDLNKNLGAPAQTVIVNF